MVMGMQYINARNAGEKCNAGIVQEGGKGIRNLKYNYSRIL